MKYETLLTFVHRGVEAASLSAGLRRTSSGDLPRRLRASREFGLCYSCGCPVTTDATICPQCNRPQSFPAQPDAFLEAADGELDSVVYREVPGAPPTDELSGNPSQTLWKIPRRRLPPNGDSSVAAASAAPEDLVIPHEDAGPLGGDQSRHDHPVAAGGYASGATAPGQCPRAACSGPAANHLPARQGLTIRIRKTVHSTMGRPALRGKSGRPFCPSARRIRREENAPGSRAAYWSWFSSRRWARDWSMSIRICRPSSRDGPMPDSLPCTSIARASQRVSRRTRIRFRPGRPHSPCSMQPIRPQRHICPVLCPRFRAVVAYASGHRTGGELHSHSAGR